MWRGPSGLVYHRLVVSRGDGAHVRRASPAFGYGPSHVGISPVSNRDDPHNDSIVVDLVNHPELSPPGRLPKESSTGSGDHLDGLSEAPPIAVSYTHLDVYKRQPQWRDFAARNAELAAALRRALGPR